MGLKASWQGLAGHHDPAAAALPARAAAGDQGAWDEIVERYAPMVWSICTRFRLSDRDLEDVAQNVWQLLVERLGKLPEPAAPSAGQATARRQHGHQRGVRGEDLQPQAAQARPRLATAVLPGLGDACLRVLALHDATSRCCRPARRV